MIMQTDNLSHGFYRKTLPLRRKRWRNPKPPLKVSFAPTLYPLRLRSLWSLPPPPLSFYPSLLTLNFYFSFSLCSHPIYLSHLSSRPILVFIPLSTPPLLSCSPLLNSLCTLLFESKPIYTDCHYDFNCFLAPVRCRSRGQEGALEEGSRKL